MMLLLRFLHAMGWLWVHSYLLPLLSCYGLAGLVAMVAVSLQTSQKPPTTDQQFLCTISSYQYEATSQQLAKKLVGVLINHPPI